MESNADRSARFDAIVREHGPSIFGLLFRFVRDRGLAEDLWQEVFWASWRRFDDLDAARDPMPWLRTLAVNRAIDHVRRRRSRPVLESDDALAERPAASVRSRSDFEETLASLPPHERAAVLLYYEEARSIAEIAAALDAPAGTVKTWLFRARQRLRRQFEEDDRRATARTIANE
ncbi:MAG: RNA polymerase sigma factor [Planctomycetes bacterium]|nr:RNA polymerase sigma factor [Planctomycetota bacterium]MBI3843584.1 RNA polymerase sigma factor [Planctomycetota bacterium]